MVNICIASQRSVELGGKNDVREYKADQKHSRSLLFAVQMTSVGQIIIVYRQTRFRSACTDVVIFVRQLSALWTALYLFAELYYSMNPTDKKAGEIVKVLCKINLLNRWKIYNWQLSISNLISALYLSP